MFQKLLKVVLQGFTSRYHIGEIEAFFQNSPFPEGEQTISEGNLIRKYLTTLDIRDVDTVSTLGDKKHLVSEKLQK